MAGGSGNVVKFRAGGSECNTHITDENIMSMISLLIPLSLVLVAVAVWAFVWAVNSGQFDDLDTPAWDMLNDEAPSSSSNTSASQNNEINE